MSGVTYGTMERKLQPSSGFSDIDAQIEMALPKYPERKIDAETTLNNIQPKSEHPFTFSERDLHPASTSTLKLVKSSVFAASGMQSVSKSPSFIELPSYLGADRREMPGYTGHMPNYNKIAGRTFGSTVRVLHDGGVDHGHGHRTTFSSTMSLEHEIEYGIPRAPHKVHVEGYQENFKIPGYTGHVPGRGHRDSMIGSSFCEQSAKSFKRLGYGGGRLDEHHLK